MKATRHSLQMFLLSCAVTASLSAVADTFTIVSDAWCPFVCDDEQHPGVAVELARKIFSQHDIQVTLVLEDWGQALQSVREGRYDAAAGALPTEAPDLIFSTVSFALTRGCFYQSENSTWNFTGIESMNDTVIGMVAGYSYGIFIDRYIKKNSGNGFIQEFSNPQSLHKALLSGELNIILEDSKVMGYLRSRGDFPIKLKESGCQPTNNLYFAMSPKNPERSQRLLKILESGLRQARKNGLTADIYRRYGSDRH